MTPSLPRGSDVTQFLHDLQQPCDWCGRVRICSPASTGSGTLWICEPCAARAIAEAAAIDERDGHAGQERPDAP